MTPRIRIGLDRYVDAGWMELAAEVLNGDAEPGDIEARLALEIKGAEVRKKVNGFLNRMWFSKDPQLSSLSRQASALIADEGTRAKPLAFVSVATASYPYFAQVREVLGRIFKMQESCTAGEVHRRMFERHGKRTTIDQATSYAFKTMVSWGVLARTSNGRLIQTEEVPISKSGLMLLNDAAAMYRDAQVPLNIRDPLAFGFRLDRRGT